MAVLYDKGFKQVVEAIPEFKQRVRTRPGFSEHTEEATSNHCYQKKATTSEQYCLFGFNNFKAWGSHI